MMEQQFRPPSQMNHLLILPRCDKQVACLLVKMKLWQELCKIVITVLSSQTVTTTFHKKIVKYDAGISFVYGFNIML